MHQEGESMCVWWLGGVGGGGGCSVDRMGDFCVVFVPFSLVSAGPPFFAVILTPLDLIITTSQGILLILSLNMDRFVSLS